MILLNFSHPITAEQISQAEALTRQPISRVVDIPVSFEHQEPFLPQFDTLMRSIPLDETAWQSEPLLVNLPSLNFIAALLLAELHGRMGYFPPVLRLRPAPDTLPPRFEVAEILPLNTVREKARKTRYAPR